MAQRPFHLQPTGALERFGSSEAIPVMLAPMAGVTDRAFRTICQEAGADLCYTEMISAQGLAHGNAATRALLATGPRETVVAVQLFGHDPLVMAREAALVEETLGDSLALIDINMGCSVRKIASKGDGCALMREPASAARIVMTVADAVTRPVTAKLRRAWSPETPSAVEVAQRLEAAGAAALTIHGRYGDQGYRGTADWDVVASVKRAVTIPVIGNGDIVDGASALSRQAASHCDGLMIGREAIGDPWVFARVRAALAGTDEPATPTIGERLATARRLCLLTAELEPRHLLRMRTIAPRYFAGMPGAAKARAAVNACATLEDFLEVFDRLELRAADASAAEME